MKPRWYRLTPDQRIVGLPILVSLLWLSQRGHWFSFTQHKGWTVLIAVAAVLAAMVLLALGFLFCLLFRRRFQFSLRSLLIFTLAVALVCNWLAVEMRQAREQKELVKAMGERTWVYYDWKHSGPSPQPPEPMWLRNLLGNDFFDTVVRVGSDSFTDDGLQYLTGMTQLQGVCLHRSPLTGTGLQHLAGMTQLEFLSLNGTQVTDAGFQCLTGLTQLQTLELSGTQVTDAGLQHLKGLSQLQDVDCENSKVTDEGVKSLRQALPNCRISK